MSEHGSNGTVSATEGDEFEIDCATEAASFEHSRDDSGRVTSSSYLIDITFPSTEVVMKKTK